jgi:hypothetical protein
MWHWLKFMALAAALAVACLIGAAATPAMAARQAGLLSVPHGDVRPAPYWRWANGCRGGHYYRFLGGWGCDYYADSGYSGPRR